MTETLLAQWNDVILLAICIGIALVFLIIGYAMGRNSAGERVVHGGIIPKLQDKTPPYHDDMDDMFTEALRDGEEERVDTL